MQARCAARRAQLVSGACGQPERAYRDGNMYVEWLGSKHEAGTRFDQLDESSKNSGCVVSGEANVRRRAWHDDGDLTHVEAIRPSDRTRGQHEMPQR